MVAKMVRWCLFWAMNGRRWSPTRPPSHRRPTNQRRHLVSRDLAALHSTSSLPRASSRPNEGGSQSRVWRVWNLLEWGLASRSRGPKDPSFQLRLARLHFPSHLHPVALAPPFTLYTVLSPLVAIHPPAASKNGAPSGFIHWPWVCFGPNNEGPNIRDLMRQNWQDCRSELITHCPDAGRACPSNTQRANPRPSVPRLFGSLSSRFQSPSG
jgi:hypothetical protein